MDDQKYISETPLFGWKGSISIAVILILCLPVVIYRRDFAELNLLISAACGWIGWGLQEREHLLGYVIKKK